MRLRRRALGHDGLTQAGEQALPPAGPGENPSPARSWVPRLAASAVPQKGLPSSRQPARASVAKPAAAAGSSRV